MCKNAFCLCVVGVHYFPPRSYFKAFVNQPSWKCSDHALLISEGVPLIFCLYLHLALTCASQTSLTHVIPQYNETTRPQQLSFVTHSGPHESALCRQQLVMLFVWKLLQKLAKYFASQMGIFMNESRARFEWLCSVHCCLMWVSILMSISSFKWGKYHLLLLTIV